jgi:hypothetical protein
MRKLSILAIAAIAVFGAACGSSKASPTPTPTATSVPTPAPVSDAVYKAAAEKAAADSILTLNDFPVGWTSALDNSTDSSSGAGANVSPECQRLFNQADDQVEIARADTDKFSSGDNTNTEVTSDASVYRTRSLAESDEKTGLDTFARCGDTLAILFKQGVIQGGADEQDVSVQYQALRVPTVGDTSNGFRIAFSFQLQGMSFTGSWDIVEVRKGRIIASVSYTHFGDGAGMRDQLVQLVADRMTKADAALPE